jgi:hypothetical protein
MRSTKRSGATGLLSALNNYRGLEDAEWLRLENTFFVAQDEFWRTVPTTPDGIKAKINAFLETATDGITINGPRGFATQNVVQLSPRQASIQSLTAMKRSNQAGRAARFDVDSRCAFGLNSPRSNYDANLAPVPFGFLLAGLIPLPLRSDE